MPSGDLWKVEGGLNINRWRTFWNKCDLKPSVSFPAVARPEAKLFVSLRDWSLISTVTMITSSTYICYVGNEDTKKNAQIINWSFTRPSLHSLITLLKRRELWGRSFGVQDCSHLTLKYESMWSFFVGSKKTKVAEVEEVGSRQIRPWIIGPRTARPRTVGPCWIVHTIEKLCPPPLRAGQGPKTTFKLDNSPKCLAQKSG